jgi:signal transduction histidine kinase/DNA-binding response OmpR family regulator/ligand-binding sensor domain-containing protein
MRILFLLFLLPIALFAQQVGWQELTISDGLSQGMIYDLEQDRQGFIWIATKDGLNRYDGHNFTVFTHDPYNEYSLSDNNCSALLVDSRGWLWVGTLNQGLNLFNTRTQRFYHLNIRDQTSANAGNYAITNLYEDPTGDIWVVADMKKLIKIRLSDAIKSSFPDQPDLSKQVQMSQVPIPEKNSNSINSLSFRPDGQALVMYDRGLQTFNWHDPRKLNEFELTQHVVTDFSTTQGDINQDIWLVTLSNRITCHQRGITKDIFLPKKNYPQIALRILKSKTVAIAADDLLWLMSPDELMRQDSLTARNAFTTLPTNLYAITDFLIDKTGNIWVGTSGYGLRKFNPKIKQFQSFLPNSTLSFVYADQQGRTYVRHEVAYDQLDRTDNRMRPFLPEALSPADKRARYLMQDRQGTFWVSNTNFQTQEMSLFKFSTDWKLLKKYRLPPNTAFGFYNNQTVEDKQGRLWIGVINGKLLQFDPKTETFRLFSYQSLLPQKVAEIETSALYFDQAGTLWIGTTRGLIRADQPLTNPRFSIYKNSVTDRQSLSNDVVSSLLDDPNQPAKYLWVGTKGGGLDRLDKQTSHFDHFTEKDGLPNKVVYGILPDEFKNLWLSTNRGLALFNPGRKTFRNFTKADGLQDDEFNTGSFYKAPSGELLFGGVHGLTAFRAGNVIRSSSQVPQAHLIGLKINNETVNVGDSDGILTETIDNTQRIDLAYNQNLLTLEFGVMDFANSAKNRYRYRLEGIDKDWVEAGTNRFANYAQLPAGNYTFQMMGSTDGQTWSKPVELQVRVHPPFYRTWWAYLFYVLVLIVISWQLYRFQTQRLLLEQRVAFEQKEANRLTELDGLKTQFFTNISHEFRTPLTLILGPIEQAAKDYAHDTRFPLIQRNASRLLGLTNQLLDLSKLESGQLLPELTAGDLVIFFRTTASAFESLAQSRQITFTFEQNEPEWWTDFDRDKLEKIVTNLLSNALKFTPAGNEVRMTVQYPAHRNTGDVIVSVMDSGIGIAPAHLDHIFERFYQVDAKMNRAYEGTGIGLALVNELVRVIGGTITVNSTEGLGTRFVMSFPATQRARLAEDENIQNPSATVFNKKGEIDHTDAGETDEAESALKSGNVLLIIDDNADIRAYVRSIFDADYQVLEAADGQEGLEKATSLLPTIVISDLMMPRLDGFGFCRALKTQETTSHIPVIMLTAKATVQDRIEGFELGADDYLTKPFDQSEIQARVRNLIQQRQRLFEWFGGHRTTPTNQEPVPAPLTAEQQFIERLTILVRQQMDNPAFTVEELAEAANLSRVQLHRKLKALTNKTATNFIRDIRLEKAAELLLEGKLSVTQVAYEVGLDNLSYFSKVFQEHYGVLPSLYGKSTSMIS